MNAPLREPSFRESVDLMFNRAARLMDLSPGLEEKIRVCNSTYTVRFGVRLRGAIHTFTGYRSVHSEHMEPVKGGIRFADDRAPGRGRGAGGADDLQMLAGRGALRRLQGRPQDRPARVGGARDGAHHPPLHLRARQARPDQPQPERAGARHGHRRARDGLDRRPVQAHEHHRHQRRRLRHRQAPERRRHPGPGRGHRPRGAIRAPRVLPPSRGREGRPALRHARRQAHRGAGARQRRLPRREVPLRGGRRQDRRA